jgi:hypothetical protein
VDDDEAVENTIVFGLLGDHTKHGLAVLAGRGVHNEPVVIEEPGRGSGCDVHEGLLAFEDYLKIGDETVRAEGFFKLGARQASAGPGIMGPLSRPATLTGP